MRREWGTIVVRKGRGYVQFAKADGLVTMRRLYRKKRHWNAEIEDIRREIEAERAGVRHVEPQQFEPWLRAVYAPILTSRVAPSTLRAVDIHLGRLVAWLEEHGDPTMDRVTRADAEAFVAHLAAEGLATTYVSRLLCTVRGAWDAAILRGVARENVWRGLKLGRRLRRETPWLDPGQLLALYAAVTPAQRALVVTIAETGLAIGEALALRWGDVTLSSPAALFVRRGKTESRRRSVPLSRIVLAELRALHAGQADEEPVFAPRSSQGVRMALKRACEKAGLPRVWNHALRHVKASHLIQAGTAPSTVAKILGHADGGVLVLKTYGRWMPQDAERAALAKTAAWQGVRARRAKRETPPG